jgi:hypothetical protein
MLASIALMTSLILGLIHIPGLAPSHDVLSCDREGGYWSRAEHECIKSGSPAAGMAS